MESLWRGIAKYNNLKAQQLGAAEMVSLNRLICGLSSGEIRQLNISAFKFVHRTSHFSFYLCHPFFQALIFTDYFLLI